MSNLTEKIINKIKWIIKKIFCDLFNTLMWYDGNIKIRKHKIKED